jgi:hypothetical protein
MNIIGLGGVGSRVAKWFEDYSQYTVFYVDHLQHGKETLRIKKQKGPEQYEESSPNFSSFVEKMDDEEVVIFVCGASYTSVLSLQLRQALGDREVSIVYIQPDTTMLNATRQKHEKVVYHVLQQYTRSGHFERIYLFDNNSIENIIGELPVIGYWDQINQIIGSTIHTLNIYKNNSPIMGSLEDPQDACRITAVGSKDIETGEEQMFFKLDPARESCYIYAVSEERLRQSGNLLQKIREELKTRLADDHSLSFGIFPTNYDRDFAYVVKHTSFIQNRQG